MKAAYYQNFAHTISKREPSPQRQLLCIFNRFATRVGRILNEFRHINVLPQGGFKSSAPVSARHKNYHHRTHTSHADERGARTGKVCDVAVWRGLQDAVNEEAVAGGLRGIREDLSLLNDIDS